MIRIPTNTVMRWIVGAGIGRSRAGAFQFREDKNDVGRKLGALAHKSGRTFQNGYAYIHDPRGGGRRREHTLITENLLGRKLRKNECVYHINGNQTDNRNCNLLICTRGYHQVLHAKMARLYQEEHFNKQL